MADAGRPLAARARLHFRDALVLGGAGLCVAAVVLFVAFDEPLEILRRNWIVTPVAVLAAAFANATAVGGGFLFVPLFLFGFGLSATASLKLSLATQAFGMTSGALGWSRRLILLRPLGAAALASGVGMAVGTFLLPADPARIKSVFGWVSILVGLALVAEMYLGRRQTALEIENGSVARTAGFVLVCAVGGVVNAWISIGIGEVVALYLLFVHRIRIDCAIATGVAALAVDSILGLAFHTALGGIAWEFVIFTVPGVIVGGRYGARLGRFLERRRGPRPGEEVSRHASNTSPLKWLFAIVVVLDGIGMLVYSPPSL
jgi:uncharacterized membrane protein YfcA